MNFPNTSVGVFFWVSLSFSVTLALRTTLGFSHSKAPNMGSIPIVFLKREDTALPNLRGIAKFIYIDKRKKLITNNANVMKSCMVESDAQSKNGWKAATYLCINMYIHIYTYNCMHISISWAYYCKHYYPYSQSLFIS